MHEFENTPRASEGHIQDKIDNFAEREERTLHLQKKRSKENILDEPAQHIALQVSIFQTLNTTKYVL